jgi:uncharacterized protein
VNWRRKIAAIGLAVLAFGVCLSAEPIAQLNPSNYVSDFAGVLDAATATRLNDVAKQIDEKAHAQIAVVTVKSTDGQDIVSYAVALYQKWGIGKKGTDRGVLILVAVQDRRYWTTVGYGLEPILPDGKVGGFGREAVPLLKGGDYSGAVSLMTLRVANVIATDSGITLDNAQAPPQPEPLSAPPAGASILVVIALIVIAVLVVWVLSRAGGGGRGSGGSGFLSGLLWSMLFSSLSGRGGGSRGSSWGGGGWGGGGFGGGGGGFGGFGGGSTGGGGAGGSW